MYGLLILLGGMAISVGFWWLLINFFRKKPKKRPALVFVTGFVFLIIGAVIAEPTVDNTANQQQENITPAVMEETQAQKDAKAYKEQKGEEKKVVSEEAVSEEVVAEEEIVEEEAVEETTQDRLSAMLETNIDFKTFADEFFSMSQQEQNQFFEQTMNGETAINWGGVVLQSQANNVFVFGGDPSLYNGEDWITLMSERPELIHYVINVSIPDKSQVAEIEKGDSITVTGGIMRAGNAEDPMVWMLENALVVDME